MRVFLNSLSYAVLLCLTVVFPLCSQMVQTGGLVGTPVDYVCAAFACVCLINRVCCDRRQTHKLAYWWIKARIMLSYNRHCCAIAVV